MKLPCLETGSNENVPCLETGSGENVPCLETGLNGSPECPLPTGTSSLGAAGGLAPVEDVRLGRESSVEDRDASGLPDKRSLHDRRLVDEEWLTGEAALLRLDLLANTFGEVGLEP